MTFSESLQEACLFVCLKAAVRDDAIGRRLHLAEAWWAPERFKKRQKGNPSISEGYGSESVLKINRLID